MRLPIRLTTLLAVALSALIALPGCGDKSGDELWPDGPPPAVIVPFEGAADAIPGAVLDSCASIFSVDILPEDDHVGEIATCILVFELSGSIDAIAMKLTNPNGDSQSLTTPTSGSLEIPASDFVGTEFIDGVWRLEYSDTFDCDVIDSLELRLTGEYEE